MRNRIVAATFFILPMLAGACLPDTANEFIGDRQLNTCTQAIPTCPELTASCQLDQHYYTARSFPAGSPLRFLVVANTGNTLHVNLHFSDQKSSGERTRIVVHEPGCSEIVFKDFSGPSLFNETSAMDEISQSFLLKHTGEHLVELHSDMIAEILVRVDVVVPEP